MWPREPPSGRRQPRSGAWGRGAAAQAPRTLGCPRTNGRYFWPACQDLVNSLHFLQETAEGLVQSPDRDTHTLGPCSELKALETLGPLPLARNAKNMLTPISQPSSPAALSRRRPWKQSKPHWGAEKVDPLFEIIPSYSLACSSRAQAPSTGPAGGPEKYGTRCSSCWLVSRKSVQPKKLCGRCGVSLGPSQRTRSLVGIGVNPRRNLPQHCAC
ncbi:unnamed protein product [Nyctereutes procyonoides]|uniref:(raccoon dog) hypothetical protein n=1 Tax=Nyctereutes procyonoides TaxID=34880 RepID=A0A811YD51_NYCPR|nr:unnamed protein product [Nyctereutes procyonoides]